VQNVETLFPSQNASRSIIRKEISPTRNAASLAEMRADPTLVDRDREVANGKDLTSPAISVAKLTVCRSSLHRDVPYCAVSVSLRVVQLSPEPELLSSDSLD
jgi:hypothetical protein